MPKKYKTLLTFYFYGKKHGIIFVYCILIKNKLATRINIYEVDRYKIYVVLIKVTIPILLLQFI